MMNKNKKKIYIDEMKNFFSNTSSVFVTHYQGLTVKQLDELRKEMREQGTLTADASRTPGPAPAPEDTVQVPDDTQQDISSLLEKQPTKEAAMAERDAYINILEKRIYGRSEIFFGRFL